MTSYYKAPLFWDLRKPDLPLFRALQSVSQVVSTTLGKEEPLLPIPKSRVPSKQDVQRVLDDPELCSGVRLVSAADETPLSVDIVISLHDSEKERNHDTSFHLHLRGDIVNELLMADSCIDGSSVEESQWYKLQYWPPDDFPAYAIIYKPRGVICTLRYGAYDDQTKPHIAHLLDMALSEYDGDRSAKQPSSLRELHPLLPVGRLDLESEGLLLLTSDGTFSNACTSPSVGIEKTYRVLLKAREGRSLVDKARKHASETSTMVRQPLLRILINQLDNFTTNGVEISDRVQEWVESEIPSGNADEAGKNLAPNHDKDNDKQPNQNQSKVATFSAETCRIVDIAIEQISQSHWSQRGESLIATNGNAENGTSTDVHTRNSMHAPIRPAVFIMVDVIMKEGTKREVRRLMRSVQMTTLMLVRIAIAGIDCSSMPTSRGQISQCPNDNNRVSNFTTVPPTISAAFSKCSKYAEDAAHQACDTALQHIPSTSFRYLSAKEVDDIFGYVQSNTKI